MGVPVSSACSFAKATRLPANDTEPITMLKTLGNATANGGCDPCNRSSDTATTAAAPPPTPLKSATIWGMAVIFTRRAPTAPIGTPIRMPTIVITIPAVVKCKRGMVASRAITMPTAAIWLPRRALFGELNWIKPRMKRTAARR